MVPFEVHSGTTPPGGTDLHLPHVEACIASAASKILDGRELGRKENFFAAGLHSVSIARMRRCLEEELGPIPATAFFQHPSVCHLAAFLVALRTPAGTGAADCGDFAAQPCMQSEPEAFIVDALSEARLLLQFGGDSDAALPAAARVCQSGLAQWRLLRGTGRASFAAAADESLLEAARQLHLLAADVGCRLQLQEGGGLGEEEPGEAVAEAFGEALALSAAPPDAADSAVSWAGAGAAEEAAVLAVWAELRRRSESAPHALDALLARFHQAALLAEERTATGWGRAAGELHLRDAEDSQQMLGAGLRLVGALPSWKVSAATLLTVQLEEVGLVKLPQAICAAAVNLRVLDLSHNRLAELSKEVGGLRSLRTLALASNSLTLLPDEVGDLPSLTSLNIAGNRIRNAYAEASECRALLSLDASVQSVDPGCLSAETRQRTRRARGGGAPRSAALETLEVSFSQLMEGPSLPLGCGASLRYYLCAGNDLDKFPDLKRCPGLTSLALGQNVIRAVPPKLLSGLPELRWLSLEANRIPKLPSNINALTHLRHLMLQGNRLESLPEELGACTQLRVLEVQHNRLLALPASMPRLRVLQFFYAHGNELQDAAGIIGALRTMPALKLVGLGGNRLAFGELGPPDRLLPGARVGLAWNEGSAPLPACGPPLTELLSCGPAVHFEGCRSGGGRQGRVLAVCFMAQGAPTAQWVGQVQACRASLLDVDALYVCDPANAWYLQDPARTWRGTEYFLNLVRGYTAAYGSRVLMLGSSMGASACLLFAELAGLVLAFSPQVELRAGQGRFLDPEVLDRYEARLDASLQACKGRVVVHVGRRHHFDARAARKLLSKASCVELAYHETELHNTAKFLQSRRGPLTGMVKLAVAQLLAQPDGHQKS